MESAQALLVRPRRRSVGVWGLGREGRANLRKLLALGAEPVLVDDQPPRGGVKAGRGCPPPAPAGSPACRGATWW